MTSTASLLTPTPVHGVGQALLVRARALHQSQARAEADLLAVAARYADHHPPTHEYDTVAWDSRFGTGGVALNASGIPEVSAAAIAELATALGQRHSAARTLVAHALQLRHRLPQAWVLVTSHRLVPMVARKLADHTFWCNEATAAFVDGQVTAVAGQLTLGQVEKLVTAAILQLDPEHPDHDKLAGTHDPRGVWIQHSRDGKGVSHLSGTIDVQDGLNLDAALDVGARDLARQPGLDGLTHQARRGYALGDLSRRQPGLDLTRPVEQDGVDDTGGVGGSVITDAVGDALNTEHTATDRMATSTGPIPATAGRVPILPVTRPTKPITLYVHLHPSALTDGGCTVGRVENTQQPVTTARIREWLGDPAVKVTVTPIMHAGEQIHTDAYEIPDRLIRQIELTELTCVFPWCDKPAVRCDKDHQIPYHHGGTTSRQNLAPLCRTHHLLKTHTRWRYQRLQPAPSGSVDHGPVYLWTSPYG
ncbi:MAG: HNH endonuclease, partial [Propionibacteriales bacterium]|nr:HNH endonuclease [Propionibacteriales bacterium]